MLDQKLNSTYSENNMPPVKEKQLTMIVFVFTFTILLVISAIVIWVQQAIWAIFPFILVDLIAAVIGTFVARLIFRAYVSNISSKTPPHANNHQ
jgi:hypothetical protein